MDKEEILDTLKEAQIYLNKLKCLDAELENAVKQIIDTFEETEKTIHETFSNLKDVVLNILNKREEYLLKRAAKTKNEGRAPLEECRKVISNKIEKTNKLMTLGNCIVNDKKSDDLVEFFNGTCSLGSLPEVPELKEVPFISFIVDQNSVNEVNDILNHFGEICRIAPVQIKELHEKPGALLVEWHNIEIDDKLTDIQEYRLQKAFGDVVVEKHLVPNFHDCYRGLESQYLVKDLQVNQSYSFRVCCKFEGSSKWSPWSLPQVSKTKIRPFSWKDHDSYNLLNENRIAKPVTNSPGVLYSDGPQFCVGHSIDFTFLEVDLGEAVVGLVSKQLSNSCNITTDSENSFLINRNGNIFVDGAEKCTKLSSFSKGLKVTFSCDLISDHKVRMNIDCNEKRVTYEWLVDPSIKLFFASQFFSRNWKIMVE